MENYTVAQVARVVNVAPNTIRSWSRRYKSHLSSMANPSLGTERRYTDDDVRVLSNIAAMRNKGIPAKDIQRRLNAGDILIEESNSEPSPPEEMTAIKTTAQTVMELVRGQVVSLTDERDYLRGELDSKEKLLNVERDKRREFENRALTAEVERDTIKRTNIILLVILLLVIAAAIAIAMRM